MTTIAPTIKLYAAIVELKIMRYPDAIPMRNGIILTFSEARISIPVFIKGIITKRKKINALNQNIGIKARSVGNAE
ncbi:MAG TPA: hypothetical protein VM050_10350 [Patescibacteria group bacterium]|nr:hypothetical protein [Patescibacteria group bacterium]